MPSAKYVKIQPSLFPRNKAKTLEPKQLQLFPVTVFINGRTWNKIAIHAPTALNHLNGTQIWQNVYMWWIFYFILFYFLRAFVFILFFTLLLVSYCQSNFISLYTVVNCLRICLLVYVLA